MVVGGSSGSRARWLMLRSRSAIERRGGDGEAVFGTASGLGTVAAARERRLAHGGRAPAAAGSRIPAGSDRPAEVGDRRRLDGCDLRAAHGLGDGESRAGPSPDAVDGSRRCPAGPRYAAATDGPWAEEEGRVGEPASTTSPPPAWRARTPRPAGVVETHG